MTTYFADKLLEFFPWVLKSQSIFFEFLSENLARKIALETSENVRKSGKLEQQKLTIQILKHVLRNLYPREKNTTYAIFQEKKRF